MATFVSESGCMLLSHPINLLFFDCHCKCPVPNDSTLYHSDGQDTKLLGKTRLSAPVKLQADEEPVYTSFSQCKMKFLDLILFATVSLLPIVLPITLFCSYSLAYCRGRLAGICSSQAVGMHFALILYRLKNRTYIRFQDHTSHYNFILWHSIIVSNVTKIVKRLS